MLSKTNMLHPRYDCLLEVIDELQPDSILEVGTWIGQHACEMIQRARKHRERVCYYGFDLFAQAPAYEHPKRWIVNESVIRQRLDDTGARIWLIKGDTRQTLRQANIPPVDLIFIDGGHSLETVENDWRHTQQFAHSKTVWILDDYWPAHLDCGCRSLVDSLPLERVSFLSSAEIEGREIRIVRIDPPC